MIDGLFKKYIDPLWEAPARPLARVFTANQVTLMGLGLIALVSLAYVWHRAPFWYAVGLAIAFSADSLDGAVARIRRESSKFGGYLDAIADRYQEMIALAALAYVSDAWAAGYFALSGAFLTSYMKARAAMETKVDNAAWPDLFERQERIFFICLALVCQSLVGAHAGVIPWALWLLAILTHLTAAQRFLRAKKLLQEKG
ncbi:MAG: CDP-alcohol phosphatidyltransferase family protein [Aestuariivirga sp.]|uniref:CDP-alcohol phosphatidyltransferase family protein n=1 Tax=Aestuariivirga sp. TaxID=2650926 RepID=UPI0025BD462E|nr:CDP-alcohol phosphatidyltransferase family protein [Aestuariivirga sp.]MCA3561685.1 CDP-alcohol phosphatidyltransferase family protein [Aestuariivirga sp.]